MAFTRYMDWMWADACALLDKAARLEQLAFGLQSSPRERISWRPPADIWQTQSGFIIVVALPGVTHELLRVDVQGASLTIEAQRMFPERVPAGWIRNLELPHGRFERQVDLPPGDYRIVESLLENGLLTLMVERVVSTC